MTVHTSSREDLARYPGQDTLYFILPMTNGRSFVLFWFFCYTTVLFFLLPPTPLGAIPCALMLKRHELSQFIIGKDDLAVNTA